MSAQELDALRSIYAAFNRRDMPAFLEHFHPEIVISTPDDLEFAALMMRLLGPRFVVLIGTYRGEEETRRLFEAMWAISERFSVEAEEFVEMEDGIAVAVRLRTISLDAGIEGDVRIGHAWTFADGKAITLRVFSDRERAISALRPPEGPQEE